MVEIRRGNLIEARTEALVNTVNCWGYMGKGVALQFKKAFPANFEAYRRACRSRSVELGKMFVFETGSHLNPKYIINFPTKRHWRAKSRLADIRAGLEDLVATARRLGLASLALPPLGCGLGGLDWDEVRPIIAAAFADFPELAVALYEPLGAHYPRSMPVRTTRP